MNKKLTDSQIETMLSGRDIGLLEPYINCRTSIKWQCLRPGCLHTWKSAPTDILFDGKGCRKCAGNLQLTDDIVNERLKIKNIKKLGTYQSNKSRNNFQCSICDYIWEANFANILNKSGCPNCSNKAKLTNSMIDEAIKSSNILRVGNVINSKTPIMFQCLISTCNYRWTRAPGGIESIGCPKCAGRANLTNEFVDEKLRDRQIKRLDPFINVTTKIRFQCLKPECGHIWSTVTTSVINKQRGCPLCLNKNEKLILHSLKNKNIQFEYQKNIRKLNKEEVKDYRVDFYLPSMNVIVEYNGAQHYEPVRFGGVSWERAKSNFVKQQSRDLYIANFCENNNIRLIIINGLKLQGQDLENFLKKEFWDLLGISE